MSDVATWSLRSTALGFVRPELPFDGDLLLEQRRLRLQAVDLEARTSIKLEKPEVDGTIPTDFIREIHDTRSVNPTGRIQVRETRSETFEATPKIEIANLGQVDLLSVD